MDGVKPLTDRQREVLLLYSTSLTCEEVGQLLDIHPQSVRRHLANTREAMNCSTTLACVLRAIAAGELALDTTTGKLFVPSPAVLEEFELAS